MLKYPCLVLDHDDTAVASELTVNYPCFLLALEKFRPGETMDYPEFVDWCFRHEFTDFLRIKYNFSDEELLEEYHMWQDYSKTHIPGAETPGRSGLCGVLIQPGEYFAGLPDTFRHGTGSDLLLRRPPRTAKTQSIPPGADHGALFAVAGSASDGG